MKQLFRAAILCVLMASPAAWAQTADDQYVGIYNAIQQADVLAESGQWTSALAKYSDAQTYLNQFQTVNPDWNTNIVAYRLKYLSLKIAAVSSKIPKPAPAAAAPTNAPTIATQEKPVVETVRQTVPVVVPVPAPPPATAPPNNQDLIISQLRQQLSLAEADNEIWKAKLKEALAARPAAVDPVEFYKTQQENRELQKRNEVLEASLDETKTKLAQDETNSPRQQLADTERKLAELTAANAALTVEKAALEARAQSPAAPDATSAALREENNVLKKQVAELKSKAGTTSGGELARKLLEAQAALAVLESDKEMLRLENVALTDRVKQASAGSFSASAPLPVVVPPDPATAEKIKQLEKERDSLQKKLDAAMAEIAASKSGKNGSAAQVNETSQELAGLRAQLEILEAHQVPYTPEELALLSKPGETMLVAVAHRSGRKSPNELPAKATALLAEAKRDVANNELDKAELKYQEILKLDEKNSATLADLASIQVDLEHTAEAQKNITTALAIEPGNEYSLFVLGRVKFQESKFDEAYDALSRAAQMNPDNAEIQNYLGITLSEKGLRGPAEAALRRAVQIDPSNASAHANLAFVYITQQPPMVELARLHYQKALAAGHPRNPEMEKLLDPAKNVASGGQ